MNKSEQTVFNWLKETGHQNIVFQRHSSPDFLTSAKPYEVKTISTNNAINFSGLQIVTFKRMGNVIIIIVNRQNNIEHIVPFAEFISDYPHWNKYYISVQDKREDDYDSEPIIEKLLTIQETGILFSISKHAIRRWIISGKLHAIKIGRTIRVSQEEIARLKMVDK
jgi:excisionase family DNA binding protein